ncbi:MAG: ankyrin repeat domain-containing protein [Hydrogenophaga sp.]|uniref:ankyrin repeat domain-containing protein n=1 Tax=Hydrogenophaga sp. TaxID=1904254 RepID=UPI003D139429
MDELISAIANGGDEQSIQAIIERLRVAEKDLNAQDNNGWTPAHFAAFHGRAGAITALGAARAKLDAADIDGHTPAHIAAFHGHAGAITALGAARANQDAADIDGHTPAHIAAFHGHAGAITALGAARANLDAANIDGHTPSHMAAFHGHAEAITALRDAGANLDATDRDGLTPANLAAFAGRQALANAFPSYIETALMTRVTTALDASSEQSHKNLAADLTCQILATPYTSRGDTRPVKLPDGIDPRTKRPITGSVLSAAAAARCMQPGVLGDHGRPPPSDPMTKRVFLENEARAFLHSPGFVQGDPARLALVTAVGEACRQTDRSPQALIAAATAASAAQAAAAVAAPAPLDFRAILATQGAGAAAGAGGGAAAPRPDRGGPAL